MPAQLTTLCIDTQSDGVQTPDGFAAPAVGVLKKRWIQTRHLSIASSGVTAALITVLLLLSSVDRSPKETQKNTPVCKGSLCIKTCSLIPFCVILSDASKHVFLFNYELLYLKDVLWRPEMPKCVGIECVVKPKSATCRYNHMFAGVSVCFNNATALGTIGFSDFYTNAHVIVNGTRFKQMFNKLMHM